MKLKFSVLTSVTLMICGGLFSMSANAEDSWLSESTIGGFLSAYYWTNIRHHFTIYNQNELSIGGGIYIKTPKFYGFSATVEPLSQSNLGIQAENQNYVSPSLGPTYTTLGQANIEYTTPNDLFKVKAGDMKLDSPWNNSDTGFSLLPQTFQGVEALISPTKDIKLTLARIFKYRSWYSGTYGNYTRYSAYLNLPNNGNTSGFTMAGISYNADVNNYIKTSNSIWFYDYYQYARTYTAQTVDSLTQGTIKPIIGLQFMDSQKKSGNLGKVNSQVYGAELGIKYRNFKFLAGGDYLPSHKNSFNYGGLVVPYDSITSSGPLFGQALIFSTEGFGSGTAGTVRMDYTGIKNLFIQLRYTNLHMRNTESYTSYNEYNAIFNYNIKSIKGLSVTDIMGYGIITPGQQRSSFYVNRLNITYNF